MDVDTYNPFIAVVQWMANTLSLDVASCKMLVCMILSFPVSAVFKRLPDNQITLKNVYIITFGAIYIFFILEIYGGFLVLAGNAAFTYLITRYYRSKLMPWINFIFLMALLCFNHLKTQFSRLDPGAADIDITGAQMILVMKLSSYGWSYRDGLLYHSDRERFNRELNQFQRARAILTQPSVISYLGYVFFYASIVTGPSFDFADYEQFILTEVFDDVPESKRPGRRRKRKIPKCGTVALMKVLQGVFFAVSMLLMRTYFSVEYTETAAFAGQYLIVKILYLWVLGYYERLKYYTAWLISEASCIVCGLGYNGFDPKTNKLYWNRVQNVDPVAFEFGQNVHDCLEAWNMNTNKWLKNFVYLRVCNTDPKTGQPKKGVLPTFATFLTSAFWHGTMPGYYLTFVAGALIQTVGKLYRRNLRPIFISRDGSSVSKYKKVYDFVCWIVTQSAFGYICQPFVILELGKSLALWKVCYFWVHVGSVISIVLLDGPPAKEVKAALSSYYIKPTEVTKTEPVPPPKVDLDTPEEIPIPVQSVDASTESLPVFDNQEELKHSTEVLDLDEVTQNINQLSSELEEFKSESTQGKTSSDLTAEEIVKMKAALERLQQEVGHYISSLDSLDTAKKLQ